MPRPVLFERGGGLLLACGGYLALTTGILSRVPARSQVRSDFPAEQIPAPWRSGWNQRRCPGAAAPATVQVRSHEQEPRIAPKGASSRDPTWTSTTTPAIRAFDAPSHQRARWNVAPGVIPCQAGLRRRHGAHPFRRDRRWIRGDRTSVMRGRLDPQETDRSTWAGDVEGGEPRKLETNGRIAVGIEINVRGNPIAAFGPRAL
jgi:hypothetical protein